MVAMGLVGENKVFIPFVFFFFFSSRRRHTRSLCDWSSDVCSSDLRCRNENRGSIKSGVLPQQKMGRIKRGGAAATRNGQ